jgi:glycosyltransferase involved in cell wall biosynthesis
MASRWPVERPLVVMNCSFRYTPAEPRERRFHAHLGLDPAEKVVLYHGGFFPWRGIEQLIEAIQLVPGATLVLMGYGILEPTLRAWEADPAMQGKVRVMGAVAPDELHDWVASADVAAMPIQGDTLNHRLTTPNKLFEAMAAGVPAVVSDLPGMSAVVRETGSGLLVDPTDTVAIAAAIRQIVDLPEPDWRAWRERCLAAAHATYNWETQVARLLETYGKLTGKPW